MVKRAYDLCIFRRHEGSIEYLLLQKSDLSQHWALPKGPAVHGETINAETAVRKAENKAEFKDVVRIPPWKFKRKLNDAITDELNRKLANKVYLNVGLCIALHDVTKIEESYIFPGDGSSHTKVTFRYIVFRPFIEEIIIGKIRSCSAEGVHVTLGFFDDIIIPPHKLPDPSRFDQTEQLWVWEYDTGDGKHDLFMDLEELIRFRVAEEKFVETLPSGPAPVAGGPVSVEKSDSQTVAPYVLSGAINEPGLGLLTWWENTP